MDTLSRKRQGALRRVPFAAALVLAAIWVLPERGLAQTRTVHIPEALGSVSFRAHLNAAFGRLKIPLAITSESHDADYVLKSFAVSRERKKKWHEGVLSPQQETFAAAVELVDRCGDVAWSETAGDLPAIQAGAGVVVYDRRRKVYDQRRIVYDLPEGSAAEVRVSMDRIVGAAFKGGPQKAANRIARRLRTAIRRGEVRVSPRSCPQAPGRPPPTATP